MNSILLSIPAISGLAHDRPAKFDPRQIDGLYGTEPVPTKGGGNWLGFRLNRGPLPSNRAFAIGILGLGR